LVNKDNITILNKKTKIESASRSLWESFLISVYVFHHSYRDLLAILD